MAAAEIRESVYRVTGTQKYADDLPAGTISHGAFVRLDCGRARIKAIDATDALAMPGVTHVLSADDLPSPVPRYGVFRVDQPILAERETKFWGEPVAIVLAQDNQTARAAARLVRVDYEELPVVLTADQALADDAPLVLDPDVRPDDPRKNTNIMAEFPISWGTVDDKAGECSLVIENTYEAPFIHHFAMETYGCTARPEDGGVTIISAIQHPFQLRKATSALLNLPLNKVRVVAMEAGGGFGGRGYPRLECTVAYFSFMLNRPIKVALSGEEGFTLGQREAARIRIRSGFAADGKIVFQDIVTDLLGGAYTDITPRVVNKAGILAAGPYVVPNARIFARGLFTHTPPTTAYRGFGSTHSGFAVEGQLDDAARQLGIDPVEIRLRNLPDKGQEIIPRELPADGEWRDVVRHVARMMDWDKPKRPGIGRGIAIGSKNSVPATTSRARIRLTNDGSLIIYVGTTEMGQGSRSAMPKIVAEALGVQPDRVLIVQGDTGTVPYDMATAGSRSTVTMGNALLNACENLKECLRSIGAPHLGVEPEQVAVADGAVGGGDRWLSFAELLDIEFGPGTGEIEVSGLYQGIKDPLHPFGGPTPFYEFLVTGVELHVDEETGEVTIEKLVNMTDVGRLINPRRAAGVDDGAATMGIGAAMMEQIVFAPNGRVINHSSLDYRIPTICDVPSHFVSEFQENGDGPGPFGAKGMGEGAILAVAPAVAQAICDCTGVQIWTIPFTAERVWRALRDARSASAQEESLAQ